MPVPGGCSSAAGRPSPWLGAPAMEGVWPSWKVHGLLVRDGYTSNSRRCPGGLRSTRAVSMRSVRCPERSSPIWHGPTNMHPIERHGARRGATSGSAPPPGHGSAMTDCHPWMSLSFSYRYRFPMTLRSGYLVASSRASVSLFHPLRRQPVHCPMAGICGSRNTPRPRSRLPKRSAQPVRPASGWTMTPTLLSKSPRPAEWSRSTPRSGSRRSISTSRWWFADRPSGPSPELPHRRLTWRALKDVFAKAEALGFDADARDAFMSYLSSVYFPAIDGTGSAASIAERLTGPDAYGFWRIGP